MRSIDINMQLSNLQSEHGDLPVYVITDHGQDPEVVSAVQVEIARIFKSDGDIDIVHPDDLGEYEPEELTKVIVIYGN